MTVSAQTPINRSTGNGVTTVFPYTFKIIASADMEVSVNDVVMVLNVDYTVSGAGVDAGGSVTMTTAPASGATVVRRRNMALVRTTDYQDQGQLPAATLDLDIDSVVLMAQQIDERLDRTFSLPASFSGDSELPTPQAGYLIGWDATGENLTNIPATMGTSLVDLAASSGSSLVGHIASGPGATARTVQSKLRDWVSVMDFGADATGVTSSVSAFNAALLLGGSVRVPKGTYNLDSKVSFTVDGTTLHLDAGVTLNLSGVPATQVPFGNQLHIIANNCAVIGSGPSSLLQITGGSQANALGIVHKSGLLVRDLTIDGDKAGGTAISDDTFMSGVSVVADSGSGATTDVNATIDNCEIRDFLQHGVNIYGNKANGVKVVNCKVIDNGKSGDALSLGTGIVATRGVSNLTIANNTMTGQKADGFFGSSAGLASAGWVITGNIAQGNGASGIALYEETAYASVDNVGVQNVVITGNSCRDNTRSGIRLNADTLGFIQSATITGNTCVGNTYAGIEVGCTNTSPNIVTDVIISGNTTRANGTGQVIVGQYPVNVEGVPRAFTPVVQGTSTAGAGTYGTQLGSAIKVGNIVHFQIVLDWSAHTGTGDLRISGLPYTAAATEPAPVSVVWANGLTITGQGFLNIVANQSYANLGAINNGAYSAVALDTVANLRITGSYIAAS